jgi:hypothetical protein
MNELKNAFEDLFEPSGDGCWIWKGTVGNHGYGVSSFASVNMTAHRISWQLYKGDIPRGLFVLHRCDVRLCVNPDHLFLGSHQENMADCYNKQRNARGDSHGNAKLTCEQVMEIKNTPNNRGAGVFLSKKFGISQGTVSQIRNGSAWKHLN